MTIVQVKLCQLATKVKNWRILLEQRSTACMPLLMSTSHIQTHLNGIIYTVIYLSFTVPQINERIKITEDAVCEVGRDRD